MPIISVFVPVRRVFQFSIRESLDAQLRFVMSKMQVVVMKLKTLGISPYAIIISLLMIFMGYLCYFVIPKVFFESNIS